MATREAVEGLSAIVARNARSRRAALRLRQVVVAERAGITRSVLSVLEGERRRVTLDDALALCRGLDLTLAELLDGAAPRDLRTLGMAARRTRAPSDGESRAPSDGE
jgi:transcriptional regulator with XRE-family HTH domain